MTQVASNPTFTDQGATNLKVLTAAQRNYGDHRRTKFENKPSIEYRLILLVSFIFFALAALIERVMPWNWWRQRTANQPSSIFARAWDAARTCTAYAFMG